MAFVRNVASIVDLPFRITTCRFLLAIVFRTWGLVCINLSFGSREFVCARSTAFAHDPDSHSILFCPPGLLHWFRDRNSQLLHPTGNSTLVLLTGKATLLPTLFFALHKQDSASGSFKLQFALNLHSVPVVHFALIDANWRISSFSRGFGLLGFCLPRIWIHVLRRSLELSGSIASFLQVSSTCADAATAMFDCSSSTK